MGKESVHNSAEGEILLLNLPNVQKLADYINGQKNPQAFAKMLLAFCKPFTNDLADGNKKT